MSPKEKGKLRMPYSRYVAVDVETTGLWAQKGDRIIEIGAVAVENRLVTGEFHALIETEKVISRGAGKVHGITKEMLAGQAKLEEVLPQFQSFIQGSILVAHNAKFDIAFLYREFQRLKMSFSHKHVCTLEMSRKRFPDLPNHKLGTIYRHLMGSKENVWRHVPEVRRDRNVFPECAEYEKRGDGKELRDNSASCSRKEKNHRALADARMVAAIWLAME